MSAKFTVAAIDPSYLDRVRANCQDNFGNPFRVIAEAEGSQLRCCLRHAVRGERIALIAYQPSDRGGPYAEVGPVFVHAEECDGYPADGGYPREFRDRRRLFRAYDAEGSQVHNQIVEPQDVDAAIADLLARPEVDFIHSRNVLAGCYMFAITSAE